MIEFVKVSKIYPGIKALSDISFEIDEKEFTFLVGPSGSGKTTAIRLLIKEEEATEGQIFFYDTDVSKLHGQEVTNLRQEIGVVFQDFKLLPHKNLFENIAFVLEVSGKKRSDIEETVPYVLKLVNLSNRAEAFPYELSGGEQQKVAIARAIANNPKVLIADEPTGNLDPDSSWDIIELLSKINEWGTTVIMATHGSDLVNKLSKRVIHLEGGKIISDNKVGIYPQKEIQIKTKKKIKKNLPKKISKPKGKKKRKEKEKKRTEKEFEITFTTKQVVSLPKKKKQQQISKDQKKHKSRKIRKGKDVVDLQKLKLTKTIEDALVRSGITTVKQLSTLSSSKLKKIKGISSKRLHTIKQALENTS